MQVVLAKFEHLVSNEKVVDFAQRANAKVYWTESSHYLRPNLESFKAALAGIEAVRKRYTPVFERDA
jgi:hypothetical protein